MAREYLYRAKRKDNGEWVYGLPKYDDSGAICYFEFVKEWARIYGIIPETICEYTNKKDKNGVKVFEHDVIQYKNQNTGNVYKGVVVYDDDRGQYFIQDIEVDYLCNISKVKYWEVIGNKFDNPELLEVQDEL
jgi:uncharacterized phage protein (TIGR01671 family)